MARSPAAANGGWPAPRHPAEPDPRTDRVAPQGQRPAQPAGYPQGGYPEHQGGAPGYDPQVGYHYPQNGQGAPAQPNPRHGLSSLEPAGQSAPEYAPYPAPQSPYAQPQQSPFGQPQQPAGYRPAPPPYAAPGRQPDDQRAAAAGYEQWQAGSAAHDPRGYDFGSYLPTGATQPGGGLPLHAEPAHHDPLHQQHPEWAPAAHLGYSEGGATRDAYAGGQLGYEPVHGGALEQSYAQDDLDDYEVEEPRRGSWVFRIAGAVVVAIGLGYGLAQGYKLVASSKPDGVPPVVRGDAAPSKSLPADPGGKQFAHTDAKILGRLGEGSPGGAASVASDSDVDTNGARKVQTLVIGRDGSVASPPSAPDESVTTGAVAVPGLTVVDGFGGGFPPTAQSAVSAADEPAAQPAVEREPTIIKPPASDSKPAVVAKATSSGDSDSAGDTPAAAPKEPTKTAAVTPPSTGANGYVVVLASVPASGDSRLSALRKFADMQQKYGAVLQNKTPDVQEANLGERGIYHRLLVGPPGSRAQASTLCSNLKTAGYKDCWVTAY
ncbi:MAG TPA: SPOR domain-containing protein [Hyphomicrobium sp.]